MGRSMDWSDALFSHRHGPARPGHLSRQCAGIGGHDGPDHDGLDHDGPDHDAEEKVCLPPTLILMRMGPIPAMTHE